MPLPIGITMFVTDVSIGPAALAREAEARGFESLFVPEHTHIPTSRRTPYPAGEPLPDEYRRHIDSEVADIKNVGSAGQAGALAAGLFLREFVGKSSWAHLDIAGPARSDADDGYLRKGGTGFGVRTLLELLSSFTAS